MKMYTKVVSLDCRTFHKKLHLSLKCISFLTEKQGLAEILFDFYLQKHWTCLKQNFSLIPCDFILTCFMVCDIEWRGKSRLLFYLKENLFLISLFDITV